LFYNHKIIGGKMFTSIRFSQKVLVAFCLLFVSAFSVSSEPLKVSGSVPFKEQYFDAHLPEIMAKTGLTIEVTGNGTDRGIMDVLEGRSQVAMLAAPLADIAKKLNEKKARIG